jgi:hypothetical protein
MKHTEHRVLDIVRVPAQQHMELNLVEPVEQDEQPEHSEDVLVFVLSRAVVHLHNQLASFGGCEPNTVSRTGKQRH